MTCFRQLALTVHRFPRRWTASISLKLMLIEEVFGSEIPDGDAETFGSPRDMMRCGLAYEHCSRSSLEPWLS
jgi:hypothetical protein